MLACERTGTGGGREQTRLAGGSLATPRPPIPPSCILGGRQGGGQVGLDKPQLIFFTMELPVGLSCQNLPPAAMPGRHEPGVFVVFLYWEPTFC